jgi:membrane dipeptidase
VNFFSAFVSDEIAEVIMKAQKRNSSGDGTGGTEEMPDDRTDWDSYLKWFQSLGCPVATIDQVADHILHIASVAGIDHVGIGSDFDGVPSLPKGLETASELPQLTARLIERGMSEGDVEKVLGANFMRVFEAIESGRSS